MNPSHRLRFPLRRPSAASALLAALCALTPNAHADNTYWDGTGTSWNSTASWSTNSGDTTPDPSAVPGASDIAIFNITTVNSAQTVNLGAAQSAAGLTFNNTGTTFIQAGGTNRILNLGTSGITMASGAGAVTFGSTTTGQQVTLALGANSQIWNVASAGLTATNALTSDVTTGAGMSLTKSGAGTLALNGSSTGFYGNLEVTAGILDGGAANGRRFGDIGYNNGNQGSVIANGATAIVNINATNSFGQGAAFETNRGLVAKNGGIINSSGNNRIGNLTLQGGTLTAAGTSTTFGGLYLGTVNSGQQATVTVSGGTGLYANTASIISGAGTVALHTDTQFDVADVTGNASADLTVSAQLILGSSNPNGSGVGNPNQAGFTKKGTGTMVLTAANTYSGGTTTVSAGTLLVNNTTGSGTGTSAVNVTGGTLGGTGIISGTVTINSSTTIAPGNNGVGNLTVGNGLDLNGVFAWQLGELSTANPGTDFDLLTITAGTVDITGASLGLNLGSFAPSAVPFWQTQQTWSNILNNTGAGSLTGTFAAIDNTPWSSLGSFSNTYTGNDVNLVWTPVPEPASSSLTGLLLASALLRRRRAPQ